MFLEGGDNDGRKIEMMFTIMSLLIVAQAGRPAYSVCEILATPEKFHGKSLRVRGNIYGGPEGAWLRSEDCPKQFRIGEKYLINALFLSARSEFGTIVRRKNSHIRLVEGQIRRKLRGTSPDATLTVTYTGVVEARTEWRIFVYPSGESQLVGFGHGNAFPVQLVVEDLDVN